jgi:polyferredoxin
VRVCPKGIDIRNGLQLECVNCSQSIDACDSIMRKISRPEGLIRYDTERKLLGGERKFFRPRLVVYCLVLFAYIRAFFYFLNIRSSYDFDVVREAQLGLFVQTSDEITNQFKLRISNKSTKDAMFTLELKSPELKLKLITPISEVTV